MSKGTAQIAAKISFKAFWAVSLALKAWPEVAAQTGVTPLGWLRKGPSALLSPGF